MKRPWDLAMCSELSLSGSYLERIVCEGLNWGFDPSHFGGFVNLVQN